MRTPRVRVSAWILLCASFLAPTLSAQAARAGAFELGFDAHVFQEPFSGDVFVAFATSGEPRVAMQAWFGAPPVMRFSVANVSAGATVSLTAADAVARFPVEWATLGGNTAESHPWRVQAIARRSRTGRQAGLDEGDVYSQVVDITYDSRSDTVVHLDLAAVVPPRRMPESERTHVFEFRSPSLSAFYGFDYTLRAGVLLPSHYGDEERYPVVYSITGFGGTYEAIRGWEAAAAPGTPLDDCIVVVPDATNRYGHSVFCDSASIGPWGAALVEELIPALEAEYGGAGADERYVTGVSSGGWSSLWLQVTYPEAFAGCWSHVPDPIDFHDFQGIDLYDALPDKKPRNMYVDEHGAPRPLARNGDRVLVTYEEFVRHEDVLNPGGQIRSFEATFSPRGDDGAPRRVFDVATGAIDHSVAATWRKYDISERLLNGWPELRARLRGKIHVYAGELDTFYLQGAVVRFRDLARAKGMLEDMEIEVVPGMPHQLYPPGEAAMERTIRERLHARAGAAPSSTPR